MPKTKAIGVISVEAAGSPYLIRLGDCLEEMRTMDDNSVDSIVTDPPYGLSAAKNSGNKSTGGFMGKKWDYDVPKVEIWKECLRVLKPGGHLLSFAGTRTQHRMAVNIEDAGFEIRDMIAWVYGSGFPKSHNIGKAVDKIRGTHPNKFKEFAEYIKGRRLELNITQKKADDVVCNGTTNYSWFEGRPVGQRLPKEAEYIKIKKLLRLDDRFDEFIGEAEREVIGKHKQPAKEIFKGGELSKDVDITIPATEEAKKYEGWGTALKPALEPITIARKPLDRWWKIKDGGKKIVGKIMTVAENVLKWGTGGINIDGCRVGTGDNLAGGSGRVGGFAGKTQAGELSEFRVKGNPQGRFPANLIHDGSDEVVGLFPETKSGSKPGQKGKSLIGSENGETRQRIENAYGDSGSAARFFYCAKASKSERNKGADNNNHPTVKPTKLMQYLVRLVTPKDGTVLDPFMGSGSTGIACKKEGFDFIGIELDKDYFKIAKARIEKFEFQHELF